MYWPFVWPGATFIAVTLVALGLREILLRTLGRWLRGPDGRAPLLDIVRVPSLVWCFVPGIAVAMEVAHLPLRTLHVLNLTLVAAIIASVTVTLSNLVGAAIVRAGARRVGDRARADVRARRRARGGRADPARGHRRADHAAPHRARRRRSRRRPRPAGHALELVRGPAPARGPAHPRRRLREDRGHRRGLRGGRGLALHARAAAHEQRGDRAELDGREVDDHQLRPAGVTDGPADPRERGLCERPRSRGGGARGRSAARGGR